MVTALADDVLTAPSAAVADRPAGLDDDDRRELIDDPGDRPRRDILALLGESLPLLLPSASAALLGAGLPDAARVAAASAAAAMYPQIARALGGPPTLLYTTPRTAADLTLLPPRRRRRARREARGDPRVVGGRRPRCDRRGAALRFQLARISELSRPYRVFAAMPEADFGAFVASLGGDALRARLPVALRQRLAERLAALAPDELEPHAYLAACRRAADRAGLLACVDVAVAIEAAPVMRRTWCASRRRGATSPRARSCAPAEGARRQLRRLPAVRQSLMVSPIDRHRLPAVCSR